MSELEKKVSTKDLFRGLKEKDRDIIEQLLPEKNMSWYELDEIISDLPPDQQWIIDNYLEKACRLHRIRLYVKLAILISLVVVAILLILYIFYFYSLRRYYV